VKDRDSGFRYYTADNMTQLRSIRRLQTIGLSLKEIGEYYHDPSKAEDYLARFLMMRAELDQKIEMLQARSTRPGDLTIHRTILPRQVCFCRQCRCGEIPEAADILRETYIAAARTGLMSKTKRMFTVHAPFRLDPFDHLCCIPMEDSFRGAEREEFPETVALCVYYRGPYEKYGEAARVLATYVQENGIQTAGSFRAIYLEGPPNQGENSENYLTEIAVPLRC